ncbi:hypothetical protein ABPG72_005835 [Tetrahymena utriculariae]
MITVLPSANKPCEETSSIETQSLDKSNKVKQKILAKQKVRCYKNRKFLYASISIGIILCIAAVAIFCAIYFRDHSKIEGRIVRSGSAQVEGQEIKYHQYDIDVTFKDSTQSKLTLFQTQQKHAILTKDSQGQDVSKELNQTCYSAKVEGLNSSYRFCNNHQDNDGKSFQYETFVDASFLFDEIKNKNNDPNQRNQKDQSQQFNVSVENGNVVIKNNDIDALNEDLDAEGLHVQINLLLNADTINQKETIHDNSQNNSFSVKASDLENPYKIDSNPQNQQNNESLNKRMLRFRGKSVFKAVVNAVKVAGPVIGAVVGGVVGAIGGPAGAAVGIELGMQIGSIASAVATTCLPQNSSGNITFKCDPKEAVKQAAIFGAGQVVSTFLPEHLVENISYSAIQKIF